MNPGAIPFDPSSPKQSMIITADPDGRTRSFRVELRYLEAAEKWYLSLFDAADGEALALYVPLVGSADRIINDLLYPFMYKGVGTIFLCPVVDAPEVPDPKLSHLEQFQLIWRDSDA